MGWHKTDVDGRVMWESPEGERVADPANIPGNNTTQSGAAQIEVGGIIGTFLFGGLIGLIIGVGIGVLLVAK